MKHEGTGKSPRAFFFVSKSGASCVSQLRGPLGAEGDTSPTLALCPLRAKQSSQGAGNFLPACVPTSCHEPGKGQNAGKRSLGRLLSGIVGKRQGRKVVARKWASLANRARSVAMRRGIYALVLVAI
jgi:hypothetical protein